VSKCSILGGQDFNLKL